MTGVKAAERPDRDRLLADLSGRYRDAIESEDPAPVLDPAVPALAALVGATVRRDPPAQGADIEALSVLVGVHWLRSLSLPGGMDRDDLQACLTYAAALLPVASRLVPEPVRIYLSDPDDTSVAADEVAGHTAFAGATAYSHHVHTGRPDDLATAVTRFREAVNLTAPGHPDRPGYLAMLGTGLGTVFESTQHLEDLAAAVACVEEAVAVARPDDPERPGHLAILAGLLQARYGRTGSSADLEEAITVSRTALAAIPLDDPARDTPTGFLGTALVDRYRHAGQLADLDEAIDLARTLVEATDHDYGNRPQYLGSLGVALQLRYERTKDPADLDEAVDIAQDLVDSTPLGSRHRPNYLNLLGTALGTRYRRSRQPVDLDRAITAAQEGITRHPAPPNELSNLGTMLWERFEDGGKSSDLDSAVTHLYEAVSRIPDDHPHRPDHLVKWGSALRVRYERTGRHRDLRDALAALRDGAGVTTAPPGRRLIAAWAWGRCAAVHGDAREAFQAYTLAIDLLHLALWHGLDENTREHHLQTWAGLAAEAATAAVNAGDPCRAVELLESTRSVLWNQALHLRQDLGALAEQAPELAAVLNDSRAVLDRSAPDAAADPFPATADAHQFRLEERRKAARDWDAAVEQVRRIDGFERFLRPVPFHELRHAANEGPVVIVNVGTTGSQALIVTRADDGRPDAGVAVIDLMAPTGTGPEPLTTRHVIARVRTLDAARRGVRDLTPDPQAKDHNRRAVFEVLAWTWHTIAQPVLTALGYTSTPTTPFEQWPRVWWCPTGPATMLPLHAAGTAGPTGTGDSVAERVVSSYATTLTTLTRARSRPAPERVRQLAVGIADAPHYAPEVSPLTAVAAELRVVARHLPPPAYGEHLSGPTATRRRVRDALPGHTWLHLSSHAFQHPTDASRSAFLLADEPLTLLDLSILDLPAADLAYLAACQTASGDPRLLDEARHLAAALQVVGYRHVLATLWAVSDAAAPALADVIYGQLARSGRPDSARAPFALHEACAQLRHQCPDDPVLWAPYVHLGP